MDSLAYMLASGGDDDSLKLWFWLIVGAIFLIKKVIEFLKPKEKDEETPVLDTEDHHEKRVKEVIAEMRRTNPQPRQPQPARPEMQGSSQKCSAARAILGSVPMRQTPVPCSGARSAPLRPTRGASHSRRGPQAPS